MPILMKPYAGPADVRPMQELIQRQWRFGTRHHIGSFLWERVEQWQPSERWPTMLWREGETVLAWGWIYEHDPACLYLEFDRENPALLGEVLDWFESAATSARLSIPIHSSRADLIAALEARGYVRQGDDVPFGIMHRRALDDLPPLHLPEGYRARSMAEGLDIERRVLAHRQAWDRISGRENEIMDQSTSAARLAETIEIRRPLYMAWPYRPDLDWVIEAPDGRWVSNCIMWFDEVNGVGTLEPVGTDADFRRQGFGAAVCIAALHALKAAGAVEARVGARGDDAYPVPRQVYQSIGFRPFTRDLVYLRAR